MTETVDTLQWFGSRREEGFLLWVGRIDAAVATVLEVWTPPQHAIGDELGVGYFVTGETLREVNSKLATTGLRLIAQVHSHPGEAYHSQADDAGAVATANGCFSLVVPDFGFAAPDPRAWAVYRLDVTRWRRLAPATVAQVFRSPEERLP